MIDNPSYCSFLVRLWRKPGATCETWHGEVEQVQSGTVIVVCSIEEAFSLIWRIAAGDAERRKEERDKTGPPVSPIPH
jgi:hypothetical protein